MFNNARFKSVCILAFVIGLFHHGSIRSELISLYNFFYCYYKVHLTREIKRIDK